MTDTTDLVARELRDLAHPLARRTPDRELLRTAADTIERLTRERDEARAKHQNALNAYDAAIRDCQRTSARIAKLEAATNALIHAVNNMAVGIGVHNERNPDARIEGPVVSALFVAATAARAALEASK
jgi:hypothetical protein